MLPSLLLASALVAPVPELRAQADCSKTQSGKTPLNDLGTGLYLGYPGGLYPLSLNVRPTLHDQALDRTGRVTLLNAQGAPDPLDGRFALISIGMSNATREFTQFVIDSGADPLKNSRLTVVDCAQPGMTSDLISDPLSSYWPYVDDTLNTAGVATLQVQAVWLKDARPFPQEAWPTSATVFEDDLRSIVQILKSRFPNLRSIYHSSRIYGGYGPAGANPEPFAYQYGFSVKWLIAEQLGGSPALNFDPSKGPVLAPWMSWGPYLWADGLRPRSDGLIWECQDFTQSDGIHPDPSGEEKVSAQLLTFFKNDPTTKPWFVDCDLADPSTFASPPEVFGDMLSKIGGGDVEFAWSSLDPVVGSDAVYDLVGGTLSELRMDQGFSRGSCLVAGVLDTPYDDTQAPPAPGEGTYALVRGRNACGTGTWGDGTSAFPDPRDSVPSCP